ncbi:MAG: hypothetical protein PVH89_04075 [Gammaproteobacteria bacterium]
MDLTTATSIAEIVASLGVIVSLVFVAREFRHNARNANISSGAKALETMVHQFAHLADEPRKADLFRRALVDFEDLDIGEKGQVSAVIHDILLSHDVLRRAYEAELMSKEDFQVMQELWVSLMRTTGGRQWWAGWKGIMPESVVAYVEAAVDDPALKTKPLNEALPWLFDIDGGASVVRPTEEDNAT